MVDGGQRLRFFGIFDNLADLALQKLRSGIVRRLVDQQVLERRAEPQAADLPGFLINRLAFRVGNIGCVPFRDQERMPICGGMHGLPDLIRIRLRPFLERVGKRPVLGGDAVIVMMA